MANQLTRWTLTRTPAAGGGPQTRTVAGWSIDALSLTRQTLGAETLSLSWVPEVLTSSAPFAYGDLLTLRRPAGSLEWRGWVERLPRSGSERGLDGTLVAVGVLEWWLERLPYMELDGFGGQTAEGAAAHIAAWCPIGRLSQRDPYAVAAGAEAADGDDARVRTGTSLRRVLGYARNVGLCPIDVGEIFDGIRAPVPDLVNGSCADALRALLRWHPQAAVRWRPQEDGRWTVDAVLAGEVAPAGLTLDALSELSMEPRDHLTPSCVAIVATAARGNNDGTRTATIGCDIWPPDASPQQRGALVELLDLGSTDDADQPEPADGPPSTSSTAPPQQAPRQFQDIVTEKVEHEELSWWRAAVGPAIPAAIPDIHLRLFEPELQLVDGSGNATSLDQVPRRLVSGVIQPWMVDGAPHAKHAKVRGKAWLVYSGDAGDYSAIFPAPIWNFALSEVDWAVQLEVELDACDLLSRRYLSWPTVDYSPDPEDPAGPGTPPPPHREHAGWAPAAADAAVSPDGKTRYQVSASQWQGAVSTGPVRIRLAAGNEGYRAGTDAAGLLQLLEDGIAQAMFEERTAEAWDGSAAVAVDDPADTPTFPVRLALSGGDPAWEAGFLVQSETLTLTTGTRRWQFGSPRHLSFSDWRALRQQSRRQGGLGRDDRQRRSPAPTPTPALNGDSGWQFDPRPEEQLAPFGGPVGAAGAATAVGSGGARSETPFQLVQAVNGPWLIGPGKIRQVNHKTGTISTEDVTWGGAAWSGRKLLAPSTTYSLVYQVDGSTHELEGVNVVTGAETPDLDADPRLYVATLLTTDAAGKPTLGELIDPWEVHGGVRGVVLWQWNNQEDQLNLRIEDGVIVEVNVSRGDFDAADPELPLWIVQTGSSDETLAPAPGTDPGIDS